MTLTFNNRQVEVDFKWYAGGAYHVTGATYLDTGDELTDDEIDELCTIPENNYALSTEAQDFYMGDL
jgi:hypothetical protein